MRRLINTIIPVSEGVKIIGKQMIDNHKDWVQGMYEYINLKNKDVRIWTCNGIPFIKINGFEGLSFSEKNILKQLYKNKHR